MELFSVSLSPFLTVYPPLFIAHASFVVCTAPGRRRNDGTIALPRERKRKRKRQQKRLLPLQRGLRGQKCAANSLCALDVGASIMAITVTNFVEFQRGDAKVLWEHVLVHPSPALRTSVVDSRPRPGAPLPFAEGVIDSGARSMSAQSSGVWVGASAMRCYNCRTADLCHTPTQTHTLSLSQTRGGRGGVHTSSTPPG